MGLARSTSIDPTLFLRKASNLSDLTDAAAARVNLGLLDMSTQASSNVSITGGSATGLSSASATRVFGGDGTAVLPSLAFSAEQGTGFYRAAAGTIGIAISGAPQAVVTSYALRWRQGGAALIQAGANIDFASQQNEAMIRAVTGVPMVFYIGATMGNTGVSGTEAARINTAGLLVVNDVEVTGASKGYILKSPNNTRYRIAVSNAGVLSASAA